MKRSPSESIPSFRKNRSVRQGRAVFPSARFFRLLLMISGAGFLIRLLVSAQLAAADSAVYAPSSITDMATYCALADAILNGKLPDTFYYQPFYYSVLLPFCRFFSTSPWILIAVQSLLGGAAVYLAGLAGAVTAGRNAGLWSALLCALSAILIYFTPYALLETLQAFWIVLLFFLLLLALRKRKLLFWGLAGFVLGCSVLTRGNTWCFLPPVVFAAFYVWRANWKKALLPLLLFLMFAILPQLPFAAYNSFRTGKLCGPSTAGGAVLCIGNNPESAPGGLDIPYPPTYEAWMKTEKSVSIPARMFEWFRREPGAFLELQFNKFLLFWDSAEWPNNITEYNARKSSLMRTLHFLPTGFLLALALAGGFSGFRRRMFLRRKQFLLLWGFLLFYAFSVSAFYILARFRVPVIPLLCVSGGVFLAQIPGMLKTRRVLHLLLIMIAALLFAYVVYPVYSGTYEPVLMRFLRPHGTVSPLDDARSLIQDHAQRIRGGWGTMALQDGMTIEKTFLLPRSGQGARIKRLTLQFPVAGTDFSFQMEVNGRQVFTVTESPVTIPIPPPGNAENVQISLRIRNVQGDPQLCFDTLRDYGRTQVDGKTVPCELVATLIEEFASDKDGRK